MHAFTLIELLVVMAVLAVLATLVVPRYVGQVDQAREVTLKQDLLGLRNAIDQFNRDKGRYPENLQELVTARYIRAVPVDPITQRSETWIVVGPDQAAGISSLGNGPQIQGTGVMGVFDVKSGATGRAQDGSEYASW